jgi:hypothetical protein
LKAGKIIDYLKQFDADSEISILINIEVSEPASLNDVNLYDARLAPDDESAAPLMFNTRPARQRIIDEEENL